MPQRNHQTTEQRKANLKRANDVRFYQAEVKRQLKAGGSFEALVIDDPDDRLASATVFAMLLAVPKVRDVKAARILRDAGLHHRSTVGNLSPRQRLKLALVMATTHHGPRSVAEVRAEREAEVERRLRDFPDAA